MRAAGIGAAVLVLGVGMAISLAYRGSGPNVVTAGGGSPSATAAATQLPSPSSTPTSWPSPSASATSPAAPSPSAASGIGTPIACGTLSLPMDGSPGRAVSSSAALGNVSVNLRGTSTNPRAGDPAIDPAHLTISVAGAQVFSSALVTPADLDGDQAPATTAVIPWGLSATPADPGAGSASESPGWTSLCLARFAGASQPTVLVGLDTGGVHCCSLVWAYAVSGRAVAPRVQYIFGNTAGTLQLNGDHAILVTADNSFGYQFCAFYCSGMPVEVLEFIGGRFVNTTRQHLDLVRADAAHQWSLSQQNSGQVSYPDPLGLLAAWTADQCNLGDGGSAFATLDRLAAQGKLNVPSADAMPGAPEGADYLTALKKFLAQHGYSCR